MTVEALKVPKSKSTPMGRGLEGLNQEGSRSHQGKGLDLPSKWGKKSLHYTAQECQWWSTSRILDTCKGTLCEYVHNLTNQNNYQ